MTLPPEDRDLIERVLGFNADFVIKHMTRDHFAKLLAAARAEAAPVVDDEMVRRACMANLHPLAEPSSVELAKMRAALEAALTPSQGVKS